MQLSDVNLTDPDIFQRGTPHEMFKLLRREAPVFWHPESDGPGFWAITKYPDLKDISKRRRCGFFARGDCCIKKEDLDDTIAVLELAATTGPDAGGGVEEP